MLFSEIVSRAAETYALDRQRRQELITWEQETLARLRQEHSAKLEILAQIVAWVGNRVREEVFASTTYGVDLVLSDGKWFVRERCKLLCLDCSDGLMLLGNFQYVHFTQIAAKIAEISDTHNLELPRIPVEIDSRSPG